MLLRPPTLHHEVVLFAPATEIVPEGLSEKTPKELL
jgi:hypothetical protein